MTKSLLNTVTGTILCVVFVCTLSNFVFAQECCNDTAGFTSVPSVVRSGSTSQPLTYSAAYPSTSVPTSTYRIENETVFRDEQQSRVRQVWDEEIRERRYTVYRQVPETTMKQEVYKVLKPVWTTEYRDTSYDVVRTVPETSVRQERQTISRPVWETAERDVWQTVRRPVQETYMQERRYVVNRPVTTYKTETVDRGQYVNYTMVEPGKTYNRLAWQNGGTYIDPNTGASRWQIPGLYWTPMQSENKLRQETVYQPNLVQQLTPVTTLVPETVVEQVPTTRTTYQDERILKKEPYQVMRMVQEERINEVPETRYRQVVERVQQTTPVRVYRLETHEVVREIPVTTYKTIAEERVEPYIVKVPRIEQIVETVQRPYTVQRRIPLDDFGNPVTHSYPAPISTRGNNETITPYVDPAEQKPTLPERDSVNNSQPKTNPDRMDLSRE